MDHLGAEATAILVPRAAARADRDDHLSRSGRDRRSGPRSPPTTLSSSARGSLQRPSVKRDKRYGLAGGTGLARPSYRQAALYPTRSSRPLTSRGSPPPSPYGKENSSTGF